MPPIGTRLPKSEATRLKLLDCAVAEILEVGPDNIGFTSIARRAEMSTGALYARYENTDELLIELWIAKGLPRLRALIADLEESLDSATGTQARRRVADSMSGPDPDLAVMVDLMAVSRRNETIGEIVIPSVNVVVDAAVSSVPAFEFHLAQILGIVLGVRGSGLVGLDWLLPVAVSASATRDATESVVVPLATPAVPETADPIPETDDMDRRLFAAVTHVVSRVGMDGATISRIARRADVNPASIYVKYEDKNALFLACFTRIKEATYGENERLLKQYAERQRDTIAEGMERLGVIMFRGNQSDAHTETRRLRLEIMVGSAHHDYLRSMIGETFRGVVAGDARLLGLAQDVVTSPDTLAYLLFNRFAFFGQALLRDMGYLAPDHSHLVSFFDQLGLRLARSLSVSN